MDILYLIITGMFVGFMSSFFGIGGGSLMMPILFMVYPDVPAQAIIPSSLGVIFLNSLINNFHFYKEGLTPSKNSIITLGITCTMGAGVGAYALYFIDSLLVKRMFGGLMVFIALKVFLSKTKNTNLQLNENPIKMAITGFIGALISSITGLGGGIVFVPMLVGYLKLPFIYISSFSNIAMSFATLVGILPHFFYPLALEQTQMLYTKTFIGHVNYLFIISIFSGAILTTKLGAKLNTKIDFKIKKLLLATLLLVFAIKTLI